MPLEYMQYFRFSGNLVYRTKQKVTSGISRFLWLSLQLHVLRTLKIPAAIWRRLGELLARFREGLKRDLLVMWE